MGWHMTPSKLPIPTGESQNPCLTWFLGAHEPPSQTGSLSINHVCAAHMCVQHTNTPTDRNTDHAMYNICSIS